MGNQAMGDESLILDAREQKIIETQDALVVLEKKAKFAKKFKKLYDTKLFQEVIIETMLGSEMTTVAESLVDPRIDKDREDETLVVLRSLRYLNKFIDDKLSDAQGAEATLAFNKNYLDRLMSGQEDI